MSYQAALVTGTSTSIAQQESLAAVIDDFEDDLADDDIEAQHVENDTSIVFEEPQVALVGPRMSYGLVDILFPMTPPKPKGARLVRGPLRFNQS